MKTQYWLVYHMVGGSSFESIDRQNSKQEAIDLVTKQLNDGFDRYVLIEVNIVGGRVILIKEKIVGIEIKSHSYDDDF